MLREVAGKYQVSAKRQKETVFTIENKIVKEDILPIWPNSNAFRYIGNKKYIPFLGGRDNLPNVLAELKSISPTHNICITSIAQSVVGKGLIIKNNDKPDQDFLTWMKSVNKQRQSFNKVIKNISIGERTMGNQFVEIVRGEIAGQKFLKIYPRDMQHCRLNNPDSDEPNAVIISRKFAKKGYAALTDDITAIPLWSPDEIDQPKVWLKDDKGFEHTMLHFKNDSCGLEYYGLPDSYPAMNHVLLEYKIVKYNISNFENNMNPGGAWIFKSAMTGTEADELVNNIRSQYEGEDKTGRMIYISSELGLEDVDFKQFNIQKEGSFIEYDKRNEQKIYQGHNWDSRLGGGSNDSNFGVGSQQIRAIWDAKEATLLNPYRHELIDEVIFPIQQIYANFFNKKEIAEYEMWFENSMPFSYSSDIKPGEVLTLDEQRELLGKPADPINGKKYLREIDDNVPSNKNTKKGSDNNG